MNSNFYTNYSDTKFIDKLKKSIDCCASFYFSVSFIKKAGLKLVAPNIEAALARGAKGKIITTTYQNFTDIDSLVFFNELQQKYKDSFECRLDKECFRLSSQREKLLASIENQTNYIWEEYELTPSEAKREKKEEYTDRTELKKETGSIRGKIRSLGDVNVNAIEEYKEVGERYEFMLAQMQDVEKTRKELGTLIGDLTEQMKTQFLQGFKQIGENFSHIFVEMFGGGSAHLKLTDEADPLQSGIEIIAKLPGKNVPSLEGLSGGEKALIAISIYFAIMQVNAPPFCFLDEVETALDDINVERFANYMKSSKLDTQFICITHRRGTMEAADMLYGVTMQEKGVTRLIELNVKQLELDLKGLEKQG